MPEITATPEALYATPEALYQVGQLVEWRNGRRFDFTGRITSVAPAANPAAGGWVYTIEPAGDRPQSSASKYQTNVRPLFEAGDVVRVSQDPKCEELHDHDGEPTGYVDGAFNGQEAAVTGTPRLRSSYEVELPNGYGNWIAPEHLTLVRKAGELAPALPVTYSEGWRPQVGDVVRLDYDGGQEVTVRHLHPDADDFGFDYSEQRWESTVSNTYVRADQVRLVRRPAAASSEPREFDITKVKVGDTVEVYSSLNGYPAGENALTDGERGRSWKQGVVQRVDAADTSLTLYVRVGDAEAWWHHNNNVRGVQPAAGAQPADVQAAIDKALAAYKAQVRDVALQAAQDNDWCTQTEACLRELDIDPQTQYAAEVTVTFKVSAKVAESYTRSGIKNPARFLKEHLTPTLGAEYGLTAADVSVESVQINNVTKN